MKICLASNNAHKISELRAILGPSFDISTLAEIGCEVDIPETGETLEENSLLKAKYVYENFGLCTLADDSGLEIEALEGRPGVYSARYAGEHGNHEANMAKVLNELNGQEHRRACFKTVLTLIETDGEAKQFAGKIYGRILEAKQGTGGFGYDPIFMPDDYEQSFAEMPDALKNTISHRANALNELLKYLKST
jgi:XTP/dITP diphosphohydrolase